MPRTINTAIKNYNASLHASQEMLIKEMAFIQKQPFSLPMTPEQFKTMQMVLMTMFPDIVNPEEQIFQYDVSEKDGVPACFSFRTNNVRTADIKKYEKMFSLLFGARIVKYGHVMGTSPLMKYTFTLSKNVPK